VAAVPGPGLAGRSRASAAEAPSHHGEILQGVFRCDDGLLRRGLMSMPCDLYASYAEFVPARAPLLRVSPPSRVKAARAARETLAVLGWPSRGGTLRMSGNVPLMRGFGSSTSDVVAAIRAVQAAFNRVLPEDVVARIAVSAEIASDSLMFGSRSVLFAHRDGVIIEDFGCRLPRLAAVGFGTSADGRGFDTLSVPPARYKRWEVSRFADLHGMLRSALRNGDVKQLGTVATASCVINQRHLPIAPLDVLMPLVGRAAAVGLQVAHSGDVAALVFDGSDPEVTQRQDLACTLLAAHRITQTWRFTTGG
jgi:uncharacterized protein involved in propanediol utilization